jgi:hypothetical protein
MRIFCVSTSLLAALLFPVAAAAKTVPPGNSGADQYSETLPGAGGNDKTNAGGSSGGSQDDVLSATAQKNLDQLGGAGQATADLAEATAPQRQGTGQDKRQGDRKATDNDPSGSSGFVDVLGQVAGNDDSGGMGIMLPLILASSLLAAFAFLWVRRRGGGTAEDTGSTG